MRALPLLLLAFLATPATAGNSSTYTDFDLKTCKQITPETSGEEGEGSGTFECKGHAGIPVYFAEGDLRSLVSFGKGGEEACAFHQTFSGFNSVGNTIEWRLKNGKPIATILRWTVSYDSEDSSKTKTWLVVTSLARGNTCHVGYVEGAYPNANEEARKLADGYAEGFKCTTAKPVYIANAGTPTENIASDDVCRE